MAREWEVPYEKRWDTNDSYYTVSTRRQDAVRKRRFHPADLKEELDLRSGHGRRWLRVNDIKYLEEELRVKNNFDGLI